MLVQMKSKTATCCLWYFDSRSILACVFSQQFRLHARSNSKPSAYSRLCGKIKVLRSHFMYFFINSNEIKKSYMFFVIF